MVTGYPPQKMLKSQLPVPVNVTLYGNTVFAHDQVKMRSLVWALIQYDWCVSLKKGKFGDTHTRCHVKMNTEMCVMHLQATRHRRLAADRQELRRGQQHVLPHGPPKEPTLPTLWPQTLSLRNHEATHFWWAVRSVVLWDGSPREWIQQCCILLYSSGRAIVAELSAFGDGEGVSGIQGLSLADWTDRAGRPSAQSLVGWQGTEEMEAAREGSPGNVGGRDTTPRVLPLPLHTICQRRQTQRPTKLEGTPPCRRHLY